MGTWGTAVFSNDLAADVRGDYNTLLAVGREADAEELLLNYYSFMLGVGDDEEPIFWCALALAEWNKGRLSEFVKQKALYYLEQGGDLELWDTPDNQKNYQKRKKVLEELHAKLLGPLPPKKKVKRPSYIHHCPWKAGDLLAYHMITNQKKKQEPLYGKYVLLRVLKISKTPVSKIVPTDLYYEKMRVGLYGWCGDDCPDPSIVEDLEYIPFADYTPVPPKNPFDWSILEKLREEDRERVRAGIVENLFKHQVETSYYLDWIPNRGDTVDIQCIGHDPSFEKGIPEFFEEGLKKCIYSNLYALEARLFRRMKPYYCGKGPL